MKELYGLKAQDIIILLKLLSDYSQKEKTPLLQKELAHELRLSGSEISMGLARLKGSRLISSDNKPVKQAAQEFLLFGVKYVFPCSPGPITRGIPTAHSAPPLNQKFKTSVNDAYVWPDPQGEVTGQAITPLFKSAPAAAKNDSRLYEMLALVDALRVGRAREVEAAKEDLKQRIRSRT